MCNEHKPSPDLLAHTPSQCSNTRRGSFQLRACRMHRAGAPAGVVNTSQSPNRFVADHTTPQGTLNCTQLLHHKTAVPFQPTLQSMYDDAPTISSPTTDILAPGCSATAGLGAPWHSNPTSSRRSWHCRAPRAWATSWSVPTRCISGMSACVRASCHSPTALLGPKIPSNQTFCRRSASWRWHAFAAAIPNS